MQELAKKHAAKLRFALVGGVNTAIDFGILFALSLSGVDKIAANFASTSVAFVFSFFANRSFTFKSKGSAKKQILPFIIVTLIGIWVLQPIVLWLLLQLLSGVDENIALFIAKVGATCVSLVWNYVLYSRVVFREKA